MTDIQSVLREMRAGLLPKKAWDETIESAMREKDAEIARLTKALEDLFEDGEPSRSNCGRASECFSSGRCGRGAYETPLENAAGGCWFSECGCMSEAQQNAASILDEMDRAVLTRKENV